MGIGMNIRGILDKRAMTVAELSRKSGISTNTLYAIIRRDNKKVSIDILEKIASVLRVDIAELIGLRIEDDTPHAVSSEHPVAFPGLEKKVYELGYSIGYGCDYVEYDDDTYWINYPDGEQFFVTLNDLERLNFEVDIYLNFRLEELRKKRD